MKIKIFKAICFATIAIMLQSCDGDKFSQVVEVDLPEHVPMLAVTAEFSNVDTLLAVRIGRTWPTTERPNDTYIGDAVVKLYEDGNLIRDFELAEFQPFFKSAGNLGFQAGSLYRLEVSSPGFASVFAEQIMPQAVELTKLEYKPEGGVSPDGYKVDELTFEFQDPAGEENFYGIASFFTYTDIGPNGDSLTFGYDMYLETYDPLLEESATNLLLISDKSFDGKKATFKAYCECGFSSGGSSKVIGHLVSMTREKYLFLRSLYQYQGASDNPFAEPVTVQNNIEGGTGIFSLESLDTIQVKL